MSYFKRMTKYNIRENFIDRINLDIKQYENNSIGWINIITSNDNINNITINNKKYNH